MTLGTSNKKSVYALIVLGVVAAYMVYSNLLAGPDIPSERSAAPAAVAGSQGPLISPVAAPTGPKTSPKTRGRTEEFHPALKRKRDDKPVDYSSIDPTLRIDLFKKVQGVEMAGAVGVRNLFQFGAPPVVAQAAVVKGPEPKVYLKYGPPTPPPPPPPYVAPPPPPPPPIPLKYYAFWVSKETGKRTACFLADKEEIVMAGEGETVNKRYKVIRINPTSVVMEDLDVKKQQTLQLAEEAPVQGE